MAPVVGFTAPQDPMQALFQAVQRACARNVWSRGVELARRDAVCGESEREGGDGGEITLRVATASGMLSPLVTLYPEDEEWECDCPGAADPCEHVAAAVIALRQARKSGRSLPEPKAPPGRIRYRLGGSDSLVLELEREIVHEGRAHPLTGTLSAVASGRLGGPPFVASGADVALEQALGTRLRGVLPRERMTRVIERLADCRDVWLDGEPVEVSREPVVPQGRVVDAPDGFRLFIEQDPSITRVFKNGAVLCGRVLRAVGESRLTGRELETLPDGRLFVFDQALELVSEVIPDLEARIPVELRTSRLPRVTRAERPRIRIQVESRGDRLSLLPTLVYGDPVRARVDAGRLVHVQGAIPIRDPAGERARVRELRRALHLNPGRRVEFRGADALAFAERLRSFRGDVEGDAHRSFQRAPGLEPRFVPSERGDDFELFFESPAAEAAGSAERSSGGRRVSGESVLRAWREGDSLIPLAGGGLAPLPEDWLSRFGQRVADLLAAREAAGHLPPAALPDLARLCDALETPLPPDLARLAPLLDGFSGIPEVDPPEGLRRVLRDYQRRGIDWLCFLREAGLGALLADDMGLGKTLQALCALRGPSLVVAPTSMLHVWEGEIRRFRPGLRHAVYHGPGRRLDPEADVTLTSYALLRLDSARLASVEWGSVVLDEAQAIKNPDSQVAQAAYGLSAGFRIALTGTPVENRLDELWSLFHFLNRGLLGGRRDFDGRTARPVAEGDPEATERLRERIRPFVLRRLKREVASELPPRTEVILDFEPDEEERRVYDAVRAATVEAVVERLRSGGNVMEALEALLRLRQAACHPGLVPGQRATRSSKVELLLDRLAQVVEDGHRALVFSQWTALLDRIEPHLHAAGLDFERLDGATRDREAVVARFQREEGPPVMLVSLKAGGTGLTLTAADHVFLMDPWWNPAVEDQAADRAHRIGQTRPVIVHRLVALGTVEERILELHARKRALSQTVLGEAGDATGLTREDLLALLS